MKISDFKTYTDCNKWKNVAVWSLLLGFIAGYGLPPYCMLVLFVGALIAFMRLMDKIQSKKMTALAGFTFGFSYFAFNLAWINNAVLGFAPHIAPVTILIFIAWGIWGGGYVCVASFTASFFAKGMPRHLAFAALWIVVEYLRAHLFTGFAWNLTATVWINDLPMLQTVAWFGSYGLGLFTMLFIAMMASSFDMNKKDLPKALLGFAAFAVIYSAGYVRIMQNPVEYTNTTLRLVQPNLPPRLYSSEKKANEEFMTGLEMSIQNLPADTDYIVWAETALPYRVYKNSGAMAKIMEAIPSEIPLITGALRYEGKKVYNSALIIDNGVIVDHYDKSHLVPFGEIVPFEKYLRPLGSIFNFPMSGFSKGQEQQNPFNVFSFNLLPVICYESIFPELIRNADNAEINGIVMVSNDGWFGETRGPLEHLAIAKIRALELQKPILRSTNNGVTAIIDAKGNISASIPADEASVLSSQVTLTKGLTPYARLGNIPFLIMLFIVFCCGFIIRNHHSSKLDENLRSLIRP